ncbi:MAG TPA: ATP synthase F1 subunit delta, partial [Candidatus Latescibacteria bacterium]|nr:ATP synthase F1 subunit delta [Candidatus Latescibacterota bacterium]
SKQREHLLAEILEACRMILDERDGIVNAEVTSAVALSSAQKDLLKTKLESYTGKHIRMQTRVNPDIIGGFAVRVGDLVFDSSLAVQLQQMRHALIG